MNVKKYNVVQNMLYLLGIAYRKYKILFVFILLEMLCSGILPLFGLYLPRLAVQLVLDNRGLNQTLLTLGVFSAAYVVVRCVSTMASHGKYPYQNNLRTVNTRLLFYKALDCDYSIMETGEGQTWYQKARNSMARGDYSPMTRMFDATASLISGGIAFGFLFRIISDLSLSIVALLLVLSVGNYVLDGFALRNENRQRGKKADLLKKTDYVEWAMSDVGAAKDIRMYNLSSLFTGIKQQLLKQTFALHSQIQNRYFLFSSLKMLITVCRDGAAYAYCIWQVIHGTITIPDFVLYMGAVASFSAWLNGIISDVFTLRRESPAIDDLRAFFDHTNRLDPDKPLPISKIAAPVDVEFRNVSFRYADGSPKILDGLSFHLNANEKIALVGVNGAGKTTIVKLLCGFYRVSEGEILINGYNIDSFRRADLYTLFSAVFQDICILPATVGENVSFQPAGEYDEDKIWRCLEEAGIKDEFMGQGKKLAAPMLRVLDETGLLLARALYKDAPLLILDEPTAALDPIAESETYEKFHQVTRDKTALYISHRLASTRFCDRILMLKDGRIIESGSHDQLMGQNGEYAYVYEIQSHYYRRETEAEAI